MGKVGKNVKRRGEINMEAIIAIVAALVWPIVIILIVIVLKREWNKQNREK